MGGSVDDVQLTKALCAIVGAVPGWSWRESGPAYTASELGVFYGPIADKPDRAIGVRLYGVPLDDVNVSRERRVQFRVRGAPGRPDGADEIASVLRTVLSGVIRRDGISEIRLQSMAPLGADTNGREERSENYLVVLDNEEASS